MKSVAKYMLLLVLTSWAAAPSAGPITFEFEFSPALQAPTDWNDASGNVTFDDVGAGSFLLSSLTNLSMQFELFGEVFTLADAATPLSEVIALITNTGPSSQRLVFSNTLSSGSGPLSGSLDLVNTGGAGLGFSPPFFGTNFVLSVPVVGSFDGSFGSYRAVSQPVPVTSSLVLCLLGLCLLLVQRRLRRVPSVAPEATDSR